MFFNKAAPAWSMPWKKSSSFEELLNKLQSFENEDQFNRELELLNWLENIKL